MTAARPAGVAPGPAPADGGRWGFAHVPALDGLRGAAVAAVLLFHAGHLSGGYLGVDLFFVLSGYLITSLLLAEHAATGRIDLRAFWVRRARRLLPAVLLLLGAVAAYAVLLARPVDLGTIRGDGLATLGYVANWHTILRGSSYWDISLAPSPLQHTWSLAIEEQFYLLWPVVVAAVAARRGARMPATLGRLALALAVASATLFVVLHRLGASETRVYEGTDTRAAALLLGVSLAVWRARAVQRVPLAVREGVGLAALLPLGAVWSALDGDSPWLYRGGLPVASVLAVLVLAAAADPASPVLGRVLAVRPLRALGLVSYGLYLWHWPIYQVLDQRNGRLPLLPDGYRLEGAGLLAAKVGLSLAAATASYVLVEQPVRRGALRGRVGGGAAVVGLATAAALVVWSTAGGVVVPGPGDEVGQAAATVPDAPTVLFAGDSVAESVVRHVVADPAGFGVNPVNATEPGCSVVFARHEAQNFVGRPIAPPPCVADPAALAARPGVDAVFFLLGARPNDFIRVPDGRLVRACDPAFDEAYRTATAEVLEGLAADGRTVVVGTVARSGAQAIPVEGADERSACVNRVLAEVVDGLPDGHLVDLDELVCPGRGPCREELDGAPVRSDGLHYDPGPGGRAVAAFVVARTLAAVGDEAARTDPRSARSGSEPAGAAPVSAPGAAGGAPPG